MDITKEGKKRGSGTVYEGKEEVQGEGGMIMRLVRQKEEE